MRKMNGSDEIYTNQIIDANCNYNNPPLTTKFALTEVPRPHASPNNPYALNETTLIINRPQIQIPYMVLPLTTTNKQFKPLISSI